MNRPELAARFPSSLYRYLQSFIGRYWVSYALAAGMLLSINFVIVWIPRQVGSMVDQLAKTRSLESIWVSVAIVLVAVVLIYLLRAGWRLYLFRAALRLSVELRTSLFARLSLQSPVFYQQHRTGDLMAAATNDIDALEAAAGEGFLSGFDGIVSLTVIVSAMALFVDWRLALVVLIPFPLLALGFKWISERVHIHSREALDAFSDLNDHVQESLTGVRTVRAIGLIPHMSGVMEQRTTVASDTSLQMQRWEAAYEPCVSGVLALALTLSLGAGSWLVWHDQLTIGQMTTMGMYLTQLIWPMFALGWVLSLTQRGKAAWARLEPILNEPLQVVNSGSQTEIGPAKLSFVGVSFQYPGQTHAALTNINLEIPAGGRIGIVGPTGSGKSTLLKLLLRQWEPQSGQVLWAGKPLNHWDLFTLRRQTAWVAQEPFLFSDTVAKNIGLGQDQVPLDTIERVARLAAVHNDVERLPNGYDTLVGERGVTLSGGQKQRVAIARALLNDASLLILDDALSAVDVGTETEILGHLRTQRSANQSASQTVLIVSHRLSSVVDADQIVVLRKGIITESGTHQELIELNGWYARQWRYQQIEQSLQ